MSRRKMTEEEKSLARMIRYRECDIEKKNEEIQKLRNERDEFRQHFGTRFHWWVELIGKQQSPSLPWLIEADAKFLTRVSQFTW